jgi:hypothetical protein
MLKTIEALRHLNTTYHRLVGLLRFNKIPLPAKDCSGDYIWSPDDLERARQVLDAMRRPRAEEAVA